jgi:hypothetical protein
VASIRTSGVEARDMAPSSTRFLDHSQQLASVGMTPLDE